MIFRNLLIDLTGNTHRTELRIDKLYPPDSASSRLGLVELRAFEMPPHARMSLTQQLLVRALIAHFWQCPWGSKAPRKLVPWGTALHDRFMLPHFIERDFEDVLEELIDAGYPFQKEWFAPHFEFRFPAIGSITRRGIHLELRGALEPWNVLGEETSAGGTARNVDSSVERLQVKVSGLIDTRFLVLCNGRRVPASSGPVARPGICGGRAVPGVAAALLSASQYPGSPRRRCLISSDTWSGTCHRGLHVSCVPLPGAGRMNSFPVNAYEAESRRLARFSGATGHTPGLMAVPPEERKSGISVHAGSAPAAHEGKRRGAACATVQMSISVDTLAAPFVGTYSPAPGIYDEMMSAPGAFRPHWDAYAASISALGAEELARRWNTARQRYPRKWHVTLQRLRRSAGHGPPVGSLDAIPLLISATEWRELEAGHIQRARLLNAILSDLYGPQKLLRGGHLPPAVVFANPGFLRPCHALPVPDNAFLHLLAVDLARSADGPMVGAFPTVPQAPSGAWLRA